MERLETLASGAVLSTIGTMALSNMGYEQPAILVSVLAGGFIGYALKESENKLDSNGYLKRGLIEGEYD